MKGGNTMINNVVLVGRTANEPVIHVLENGVKVCSVDLAIVRPFRNANNENETDFIPINFWQAVAENVDEYCGKGSIIGVQCRLSSRMVEKQGVKYKAIDINADRVIFIKLVARNKEIVEMNETTEEK